MRNLHRFAWLTLVSVICSILAGYIFLSGNPSFAQNTKINSSEIRGVWLTNVGKNINNKNVLYNQEYLDYAIKEIRESNFNTIYPSVYQGGYTLYESEVMGKLFGEENKVDPNTELKGRKLLKELVDKGHKQGLTVIPWLEFGLMLPDKIVNILKRTNPQWLTTNQANNEYYLNPFLPEAQDFIIGLITEIISNYRVDGIQLDDHFGLPFKFGYDDYTVKLYQQENNGKLPPDPCPKNGVAKSTDAWATCPGWEDWMKWRGDKMTEFIKKISLTIKDKIKSKKLNPNFIFSLAPSEYPYACENASVDWRTWAENNLINEIVPQIYKMKEDKFYSANILTGTHDNQGNTKICGKEGPELVKFKKKIAIGMILAEDIKDGQGNTIGVNFVCSEQIKRQVEKVQEAGFAGVSFFYYDSLWNQNSATGETLENRKKVLKGLFPTFVKRPQLPQL